MSTLSISKFRTGLFGAIFAAVPLPSLAQDPGMIARVNVPFSFETGAKHFAAGTYTIRMENGHSFLVKGVLDSSLVLASIEDNGQAAKIGRAVFQRCGNRYFLREIIVAGTSRRLHLQPTEEQTQLVESARNAKPALAEIAVLTER